MAVRKEKRRYTVSLNVALVEKFQKQTRELGFPQNVLSLMTENAIRHYMQELEYAKENGSFSVGLLVALLKGETERYRHGEEN